jgi:hypothetical protein
MKKSCYECGKFWTKREIPYRWKRAVLICRVINTGLSCIECYVPTPDEYQVLQSAMGALLRRAMAGRASAHREDGTVRSMTTLEVFRYWQILPPAEEALVRRLGWTKTSSDSRTITANSSSPCSDASNSRPTMTAQTS